jgi:hypothetical protein
MMIQMIRFTILMKRVEVFIQTQSLVAYITRKKKYETDTETNALYQSPAHEA